MRYLIIMMLGLWLSANSWAEEKAEPVPEVQGMNNAGLDRLIKRLDENAKGGKGYWEFRVEHLQVYTITDERADRMRVMVRVAKASDLDAEELERLMQANFDSALDARYAIAKGQLWSTYIHPLSPLSQEQFLSGVAQAVTLAYTFGSSYNSGAITFGGGDSNGIREKELHDSIIDKGHSI